MQQSKNMKICISINTTTFKQVDEIMLEKKNTQNYSQKVSTLLISSLLSVEESRSWEKQKEAKKKLNGKRKKWWKRKEKREDYWSRIQIRKFFFFKFDFNMINCDVIIESFSFFVYWEENMCSLNLGQL